MRISQAQVLENRERVLNVASALFREKGFDGVAVGDLMTAAGFTHGGFYNHFDSKESLAAAALQRAWLDIAKKRTRARDLPELLKSYLSVAARDAPGKACPAAALAADTSRQPRAVKTVFAHGLEEMIREIQERLSADDGLAREHAIGLVTRMVGALMLSRAVPVGAPLAEELLRTTLVGALRELKAADVG
jgi:TetR/AcrR family transcriptional repressor of nem operon